MNFGEKLRLLRKEKKLSQKEVAERLNISLRTYASYENNKCRPRTQSRLKDIADFYGQSVDYLQIDDVERKIEALERDSTNVFLLAAEFRKNVTNKIRPFLLNLDWKIDNNGFELIATQKNIRIIFGITSHPELRRTLATTYGHLCMLPLEHYTENYYIIISGDERTEEIVNKYRPINLNNIHVNGYSFNKASKEFYSNGIYKFISKLSQ